MSFIGAIPQVQVHRAGGITLNYGRDISLSYLNSMIAIRIRSVNILPSLLIVIQFINILYIIIFLKFLGQSVIDMVLCSLVLLGLIFGITNQIYFVLKFEELVKLINSFLILDLELRKFL